MLVESQFLWFVSHPLTEYVPAVGRLLSEPSLYASLPLYR